jgi:hypothetical protein
MENGTYISKSSMSIKLLVPRPLKDAIEDYCEYSGENLSTVTRRALTHFLAAERKAGHFNAVDCTAEA